MMIENIYGLIQLSASYYDTVALIIVCYISARLRSGVAFLILTDFTLTYFFQDWIRSMELWGSLGLDYQYALGIKDSIMALTLFLVAASPVLTITYVFPALLCWALWGSYSMLEYSLFLDLYHAWSPLYTVAMILQIYGLTRGDGDAGKRVRRAVIPLDWDRLLYPVRRGAYARITPNYRKTTESTR